MSESIGGQVDRSLKAFRALPELEATAAHIATVQSTLDKLNRAKRDSWAQLMTSLARTHKQRPFTPEELAGFMDDLKSSYGEGFGKVWNAAMPDDLTATKVRQLVQSRRYWKEKIRFNQPNGPAKDTWTGVFPISKDQPMPMQGWSVVYVLFDDTNTPAYVGSTENFLPRMKTHQREKERLTYWIAYLCQDRNHAYEKEAQLLRLHMPHLNKKRGR